MVFRAVSEESQQQSPSSGGVSPGSGTSANLIASSSSQQQHLFPNSSGNNNNISNNTTTTTTKNSFHQDNALYNKLPPSLRKIMMDDEERNRARNRSERRLMKRNQQHHHHGNNNNNNSTWKNNSPHHQQNNNSNNNSPWKKQKDNENDNDDHHKENDETDREGFCTSPPELYNEHRRRAIIPTVFITIFAIIAILLGMTIVLDVDANSKNYVQDKVASTSLTATSNGDGRMISASDLALKRQYLINKATSQITGTIKVLSKQTTSVFQLLTETKTSSISTDFCSAGYELIANKIISSYPSAVNSEVIVSNILEELSSRIVWLWDSTASSSSSSTSSTKSSDWTTACFLPSSLSSQNTISVCNFTSSSSLPASCSSYQTLPIMFGFYRKFSSSSPTTNRISVYLTSSSTTTVLTSSNRSIVLYTAERDLDSSTSEWGSVSQTVISSSTTTNQVVTLVNAVNISTPTCRATATTSMRSSGTSYAVDTMLQKCSFANGLLNSATSINFADITDKIFSTIGGRFSKYGSDDATSPNNEITIAVNQSSSASSNFSFLAATNLLSASSSLIPNQQQANTYLSTDISGLNADFYFANESTVANPFVNLSASTSSSPTSTSFSIIAIQNCSTPNSHITCFISLDGVTGFLLDTPNKVIRPDIYDRMMESKVLLLIIGIGSCVLIFVAACLLSLNAKRYSSKLDDTLKLTAQVIAAAGLLETSQLTFYLTQEDYDETTRAEEEELAQEVAEQEQNRNNNNSNNNNNNNKKESSETTTGSPIASSMTPPVSSLTPKNCGTKNASPMKKKTSFREDTHFNEANNNNNNATAFSSAATSSQGSPNHVPLSIFVGSAPSSMEKNSFSKNNNNNNNQHQSNMFNGARVVQSNSPSREASLTTFPTNPLAGYPRQNQQALQHHVIIEDDEADDESATTNTTTTGNNTQTNNVSKPSQQQQQTQQQQSQSPTKPQNHPPLAKKSSSSSNFPNQAQNNTTHCYYDDEEQRNNSTTNYDHHLPPLLREQHMQAVKVPKDLHLKHSAVAANVATQKNNNINNKSDHENNQSNQNSNNNNNNNNNGNPSSTRNQFKQQTGVAPSVEVFSDIDEVMELQLKINRLCTAVVESRTLIPRVAFDLFLAQFGADNNDDDDDDNESNHENYSDREMDNYENNQRRQSASTRIVLVADDREKEDGNNNVSPSSSPGAGALNNTFRSSKAGGGGAIKGQQPLPTIHIGGDESITSHPSGDVTPKASLTEFEGFALGNHSLTDAFGGGGGGGGANNVRNAAFIALKDSPGSRNIDPLNNTNTSSGSPITLSHHNSRRTGGGGGGVASAMGDHPHAGGVHSRAQSAFSFHPEHHGADNPLLANCPLQARKAVVLCCTLGGIINQLCEDENLHDARALSQLFLNVVTKWINDHGGTIHKMAADSVVAVWGAVLKVPDAEVKACLCAQDINETLFNMQVKTRYEFEWTCCVISGLVTSGSCGTVSEKTPVIHGPCIELSEDLPALMSALGVKVAITEQVHEKIMSAPAHVIARYTSSSSPNLWHGFPIDQVQILDLDDQDITDEVKIYELRPGFQSGHQRHAETALSALMVNDPDSAIDIIEREVLDNDDLAYAASYDEQLMRVYKLAFWAQTHGVPYQRPIPMWQRNLSELPPEEQDGNQNHNNNNDMMMMLRDGAENNRSGNGEITSNYVFGQSNNNFENSNGDNEDQGGFAAFVVDTGGSGRGAGESLARTGKNNNSASSKSQSAVSTDDDNGFPFTSVASTSILVTRPSIHQNSHPMVIHAASNAAPPLSVFDGWRQGGLGQSFRSGGIGGTSNALNNNNNNNNNNQTTPSAMGGVKGTRRGAAPEISFAEDIEATANNNRKSDNDNNNNNTNHLSVSRRYDHVSSRRRSTHVDDVLRMQLLAFSMNNGGGVGNAFGGMSINNNNNNNNNTNNNINNNNNTTTANNNSGGNSHNLSPNGLGSPGSGGGGSGSGNNSRVPSRVPSRMSRSATPMFMGSGVGGGVHSLAPPENNFLSGASNPGSRAGSSLAFRSISALAQRAAFASGSDGLTGSSNNLFNSTNSSQRNTVNLMMLHRTNSNSNLFGGSQNNNNNNNNNLFITNAANATSQNLAVNKNNTSSRRRSVAFTPDILLENDQQQQRLQQQQQQQQQQHALLLSNVNNHNIMSMRSNNSSPRATPLPPSLTIMTNSSGSPSRRESPQNTGNFNMNMIRSNSSVNNNNNTSNNSSGNNNAMQQQQQHQQGQTGGSPPRMRVSPPASGIFGSSSSIFNQYHQQQAQLQIQQRQQQQQSGNNSVHHRRSTSSPSSTSQSQQRVTGGASSATTPPNQHQPVSSMTPPIISIQREFSESGNLQNFNQKEHHVEAPKPTSSPSSPVTPNSIKYPFVKPSALDSSQIARPSSQATTDNSTPSPHSGTKRDTNNQNQQVLIEITPSRETKTNSTKEADDASSNSPLNQTNNNFIRGASASNNAVAPISPIKNTNRNEPIQSSHLSPSPAPQRANNTSNLSPSPLNAHSETTPAKTPKRAAPGPKTFTIKDRKGLVFKVSETACLGKGAFGEVYFGLTETGVPVAVKLVNVPGVDAAAEAAMQQQQQKEAAAATGDDAATAAAGDAAKKPGGKLSGMALRRMQRKGQPVVASGADLDAVRKNIEQVLTEVSVLSKLRHENVVGYLSSAVVRQLVVPSSAASTSPSPSSASASPSPPRYKTKLALIMEYIPGGSLQSLFGKMKSPINEQTAVHYLRDILKGLAFLHENDFVHRDLKPHNVLLLSDGSCKLTDFGTAVQLGKLKFGSETVMGTPQYMSPEACRGETPTQASDVWAFGIVMAEMLTGHVPWRPEKEVGYSPIRLIYQIGHKNEMVPDLDYASDEANVDRQNRNLNNNNNGAVFISESKKDFIPPAARNIILACCQRDQSKRPTVKEILQMDYFRRVEAHLTKDSNNMNMNMSIISPNNNNSHLTSNINSMPNLSFGNNPLHSTTNSNASISDMLLSNNNNNNHHYSASRSTSKSPRTALRGTSTNQNNNNNNNHAGGVGSVQSGLGSFIGVLPMGGSIRLTGGAGGLLLSPGGNRNNKDFNNHGNASATAIPLPLALQEVDKHLPAFGPKVNSFQMNSMQTNNNHNNNNNNSNNSTNPPGSGSQSLQSNQTGLNSSQQFGSSQPNNFSVTDFNPYPSSLLAPVSDQIANPNTSKQNNTNNNNNNLMPGFRRTSSHFFANDDDSNSNSVNHGNHNNLNQQHQNQSQTPNQFFSNNNNHNNNRNQMNSNLSNYSSQGGRSSAESQPQQIEDIHTPLMMTPQQKNLNNIAVVTSFDADDLEADLHPEPKAHNENADDVVVDGDEDDDAEMKGNQIPSLRVADENDNTQPNLQL